MITKKQKRFCEEYLKDLNATRAYKAVYPSCIKDETANASSSRLLRNVKVKEYLQKRQKELQEETKITQQDIINELANIAFANGTDYAKIVEKEDKEPVYDDKGNVVGIKQVKYQKLEFTNTDKLTKKQKSAIQGIKSTKGGIEIKQADKVKALELLGKHLGMFNEKIELGQDEPFEVNINIRENQNG